MKKVLVVAPHPDDETLGSGGTLLRHRSEGDVVHWLVVTAQKGRSRKKEISQAAKLYGFKGVHQFKYETTRLDTLPKADLVDSFAKLFKKLMPEIIYLPSGNDVHSDHRVVFECSVSALKWFRMPCVQRILTYETLSETHFSLDPSAVSFRPNVFIDIGAYLDMKIKILKLYSDELGNFPFPRSEKAVRALAEVRGSECGFEAAEAFMLLRETL